jgi:allantoinase
MTQISLLIHGCDPVDVAVDGETIAAVGRDLDVDAAEVVDASGLRVLPGAVDAHVHFNDPGREDWEGWASGTAAAAAGGTTTVVEMPLNAHPPTLDAASFTRKHDAAVGAAATDFALWGGLVPGNVGRLEELARCGVVGFKAFMAPSGIGDFEAADDATLYDGMAEAARLGLPVAVHAENASLVSRPPAGRSWRDWCESRPVVAELDAIARAILFARETGCSLHVVHVSTGRGVRLVAGARAQGVDVTCETCPHYLLLDEDDLEAFGAVAKCAPPLRSAADRLDLRAQLPSVDLLASDHSPAPPSLKQGDDAFAIWGGISGCQSLLPIVLTEELPVELATSRPAGRFGLAAKGRLEPGTDADLVLVDPGIEWELRADDLLYRHRQSPYVGRRFRGRIVATYLRGRRVVPGEPRGRLVRPAATS